MPHDELCLFPLDPRCALLSNLVWTRGADGTPTLERQRLWARLPVPLRATGVTILPLATLGLVRVETASADGGAWVPLAREPVGAASPGESVNLSWDARTIDNIRIAIDDPPAPGFPLTYAVGRILLLLAEGEEARIPPRPESGPLLGLASRDVETQEPLGGDSTFVPGERLGLCHDSPTTNRVEIREQDGIVRFTTPILHAGLSTRFALVLELGWDTLGNGGARENLLARGNTQGACPVVQEGVGRRCGEQSGGRLTVNGRRLAYRDFAVGDSLGLSHVYTFRERGFDLRTEWTCARRIVSSELALLRLPMDLYRSVATVLAAPEATGPAGLVRFPLVVNCPNHGTLRITATRDETLAPPLGRVIPLRTKGELWLDIMAGATPRADGLMEMRPGRGAVDLHFELTKVFPFGNTDKSNLFGWWEMPPFYSFADREAILGALPNAWLNGIGWRADLGRFANNSVADSAALCASYYADMAVFTPELAPGLSALDLLRFAAEQLLSERRGAVYSDFAKFPNALSSTLDCAWLYVAASGDWEWASRVVGRIESTVDDLLSLEHEETGLIRSSYSGIPGSEPFMTASWADSIKSGHLESYVNALSYRSCRRTAELLGRLGKPERQRSLLELSRRAERSYLRTFLDRRRGRVLQWVDTNGRGYELDSRLHLGAAVSCGLVPPGIARSLLAGYLRRLRATGFDEHRYGLPLFLDLVPAELHNNWKGKGVEKDGSDQLGVYMNGSITHHQCYDLLQALYRTGMRHEANDLFRKLTPLARSGGLCGGLHSGLDWRMPGGAPSGYEGLLAEQYHFLLAALTGYLGLELTLDGLAVDPETRARCSERLDKLRPNFARPRP